MKLPTLSIIVPCYNEEEVLPDSAQILKSVIEELIREKKISQESFILFVNDGSRDQTWSLISRYCKEQKHICGVSLANNAGHQNALMAGFSVAVDMADIMITIDADLQDDVNAIKEMVDKYHEGCDIVYGIRKRRNTDSWFKRTTAQTFYKLMMHLGVKTIYNHADFRLMSKRAVQALLSYPERNLFLRGIVPLIGYKSDCVYYDRGKRTKGTSKYPLRKMISFAVDGITSFSIEPIHILFFVGLLFVAVAFLILLWAFIEYIKGNTITGWTSMIMSIWFVGGVLLMAIAIIGEYIGKTYIEVKRRPRYNIEEEIL